MTPRVPTSLPTSKLWGSFARTSPSRNPFTSALTRCWSTGSWACKREAYSSAVVQRGREVEVVATEATEPRQQKNRPAARTQRVGDETREGRRGGVTKPHTRGIRAVRRRCPSIQSPPESSAPPRIVQESPRPRVEGRERLRGAKNQVRLPQQSRVKVMANPGSAKEPARYLPPSSRRWRSRCRDLARAGLGSTRPKDASRQ